MSYQTLYSMPCRLPCQRYMNVDSMFEGAVQFVPVPVPVLVAGNGKPAPPSRATGSKEGFDGGEYEPSVSREGYEYESFEYEPTVAGEGYTDIDSEAKCNCAPMNRPYRMESCGYNQSPTWDARRAFSGPVQPPPTVEKFTPNGAAENENADCGCGPLNRPYRMEKCGYNQSQTWTDQSTFRNTMQDRPF